MGTKIVLEDLLYPLHNVSKWSPDVHWKWRYRYPGHSTIKTDPKDFYCFLCGGVEFYVEDVTLECKECGCTYKDNPGYGFYTNSPPPPQSPYFGWI